MHNHITLDEHSPAIGCHEVSAEHPPFHVTRLSPQPPIRHRHTFTHTIMYVLHVDLSDPFSTCFHVIVGFNYTRVTRE